MRLSAMSRVSACALGLLAAPLARPAPANATQLNVVFYSEVTTLDPSFTAAYNTRNFGYLVYDTLFAMDSHGRPQPQMVDHYTISPDRLTYTFTLRNGLAFHDGTPVTAADCVASLQRWGAKDSLGHRLMKALDTIETVDAKTFTLKLKQPFGLVLEALAKPSSYVPFIMPARLAKQPANQKLKEIIGSGPFIFRPDQWRAGDSMVLDRNPAYVPRKEPADFLAGGKVVKVDSVRLRVIPDESTAVGALQTGEIDYLEYAPYDLLPQLEHDPNIKLLSFTGEQMSMGFFILNHKSKPFDDPAVRHVIQLLVGQKEMMEALGVPAKYSEVCHSYFLCGTPYDTSAVAEALKPSVDAARAALKATSYHGEPVILMQATDVAAGRVSADVLADLMRRAGFNVDLQATDWGTVLGRRAKPEGWSVYGSSSSGFDLSSPLTNFYTANNCGNYPGWNCQQEMTPLLDKFAAAQTADERRAIADDIQRLADKDAGWILWGQFAQPEAYRASLHGLIHSAIPVFWNVEKK